MARNRTSIQNDKAAQVLAKMAVTGTDEQIVAITRAVAALALTDDLVVNMSLASFYRHEAGEGRN